MCRGFNRNKVASMPELLVAPSVFPSCSSSEGQARETEGEGQAIQRTGGRLGIAESRRRHPDPGRGRRSRQRNPAQAEQARRLYVRQLLLGQAGKTASV